MKIHTPVSMNPPAAPKIVVMATSELNVFVHGAKSKDTNMSSPAIMNCSSALYVTLENTKMVLMLVLIYFLL